MKQTITIIFYFILAVVIILFSLLIARWIWGTNMPEWLKVLLIAG